MERYIRTVILSTLILLSLVWPASADDGLTGKDLDLICRNKGGDQMCAMWTNGFLLGIIAARDTGLTAACPPPKTTGAEARLIIEKFMREHPEVLQFGVWGVANSALAAAFPCKDRK